MREPVLVIMAAGMGSRFGGLKQITPVDDQGHIIIDYSLYDAWKAGFRKVVFIIKHEIEADFKKAVGSRMEEFFDVRYVFQEVDKLPEGFSVPEGRTKPWGTAHAIACAKDAIDGPFAVLNADDYYGTTAIKTIYDFLKEERRPNLTAGPQALRVPLHSLRPPFPCTHATPTLARGPRGARPPPCSPHSHRPNPS